MGSLIGIPFGIFIRFLYGWVQNYGLTLVIFTVLFRIILFPVSIKTQKNMARQALLHPKTLALKKKYGNNRERHQQELAKLHQEEGFSPFASCLPSIIQLVLFFGIIDVVYKPLKHILLIPKDLVQQGAEVLIQAGLKSKNTVELVIINVLNGQDTSFSGEVVDSLAAIFGDYTDSIQGLQMQFLGLNMAQVPTLGLNVTIIIPLLSGVTSLLMSIQTMQNQKKSGMLTADQPGGSMMKNMMYFMPILSTWIAFTFPIGIGLYWLVGNLCMILTNAIVYRIYTPEKMKLIVEAEKQSGKTKKKSRYALMMEQAMEQQKQKNGSSTTSTPTDVENEDGSVAVIVDGVEVPEEQLTNSQRIALARKRMAEKYGDDE